MKSATTRIALLFAAAAMAAAGAGCGSDDGDGASTAPSGGRASPDTEGALLTVLSYGRAAEASEVCPLLSAGYQKEIGGGDAKQCASKGETVLCPCVPERLNASGITVNGNTAVAKVTRGSGAGLTITLVRQGDDWKIDKLDPPKAG